MIAATPAPIAVCDRCRVRRLDEALRTVRAGTTIVVHGRQRGNFVVRRAVTLEGVPGAELDGRGRGTVLTILAPGVTVRNLRVTDSGSDFVAMDSGIRSNASHTTIENVSVRNTLFGIYFARANDSTIEGNRIVGRSGVELPDRGDALRVWYSRNVRIAYNRVKDARDDLIWFSSGVSVVHNTISGGRYGIHTMYSDHMTIASNVVRGCEVGSYAMYGHYLRVERNVFAENRGSTGYGIGMKSMDYSSVTGNAFVSNHAGVYVDNSPSLVGSRVLFEGNLFAYNEIGFAALPSSRDDVLTGNTFSQNYRQVAVLGGGTLTQLTWAKDGRGNYWSDYAGFDRNGDGIGDIAYQARSAYGTLSDVDDRLDLLVYSPAAKAVDFAVNALPMFAPPVALVDKAPLMYPLYPKHLPVPAHAGSHASYVSMGLLALAASFGILVPFRPRSHKRRTRVRAEMTREDAAITIRGLRKRYGTMHALNGIDLEVRRGETLGLWGPNGSGKTTLMRCLLGLVEFEGQVCSNVTLGYVPQQLPAFDMRVGEFASFIGGLHGSVKDDSDAVLRDAGLYELAGRNVNELSGGQRQRLAVAVAELGNPGALLLDEPTVGLDIRSRRAILQSLENAKREGKTIVISSHVPEDITVLADRVIVMEEGRISAVVSPDEFTALLRERREAAS